MSQEIARQRRRRRRRKQRIAALAWLDTDPIARAWWMDFAADALSKGYTLRWKVQKVAP